MHRDERVDRLDRQQGNAGTAGGLPVAAAAAGDSTEGSARCWPLPLALVALWVVLAALHHGVLALPFHAFDDATFILGNRLVVAPGQAPWLDLLLTPTVGYVVPVTVGVQALLHAAGDGAPAPFHAAALLLHLGSATLVLLAARRLSRSTALGFSLALLFATHPIVVEPLAWATGLKDLLLAPLVLSGTLLLQQRLDAAGSSSPRLWPLLPLALLAVLAKPTGALVPLAWLLAAVVWQRGKGAPLTAAPLTAAPLTAAPLTAAPLTAAPLTAALGPLRPLVLAALATLLVATLSKLSHDIVIRDPSTVPGGLLTALQALGLQLSHLGWPQALHPVYIVARAQSLGDAHVLAGLAVLVAGAVLVMLALRRARATERGSVLLFGGVGLAAYLPVSHLLAFPRFVADSYLYLPLAAGLVAVAGLLRPLAARGLRWQVGLALPVLLLAGLSIVPAREQLARWRSSLTLWGPLVAAHDTDPRPWSLLAQGLHFEERPAAAAEAYVQAFARGYLPERLANLARALYLARRFEQAICVTLEDLQHGPAPERARRNLALLQREHPVRQRPASTTRPAVAAGNQTADDQQTAGNQTPRRTCAVLRQPKERFEVWRRGLRARPAERY